MSIKVEGKIKIKPVIVAVSGGMDPLHVGHLRHLKAAKKLGDKLIVILNGDGWLKRKKGAVFMPSKDRKEIIEELECVDEVIIWDDGKDHVANALRKIRPNIFAKGGQYSSKNLPVEEIKACEEIGCKIVYAVGGGKIRSSSKLLKDYCQKLKKLL